MLQLHYVTKKLQFCYYKGYAFGSKEPNFDAKNTSSKTLIYFIFTYTENCRMLARLLKNANKFSTRLAWSKGDKVTWSKVVVLSFHTMAHYPTQDNLTTHLGEQNIISVAKIR